MRSRDIANYHSERIHCHRERSEGSSQFAFDFGGPGPTAEILRCYENAVGAALVAAQGTHKGRPYKVFRIFVPSGEPRAHDICAQDDSEMRAAIEGAQHA
jgi:hypothetical protein